MIPIKPLVRLTTAHYQSAVSMISFAQALTAQWSDIIPCRNIWFQVGITSHGIPFQQFQPAVLSPLTYLIPALIPACLSHPHSRPHLLSHPSSPISSQLTYIIPAHLYHPSSPISSPFLSPPAVPTCLSHPCSHPSSPISSPFSSPPSVSSWIELRYSLWMKGEGKVRLACGCVACMRLWRQISWRWGAKVIHWSNISSSFYIGSGGGSVVIRGLEGIREAPERDQRKYKKDRRGLTERSEKKQPGYGYIW